MCPAGAYGAYQTFTQYVQEVHSIEPTGGPFHGGTMVTVSGVGFMPIATPMLQPALLRPSVRCLWGCLTNPTNPEICEVGSQRLLTSPTSTSPTEIVCATPVGAEDLLVHAGDAFLGLALNVYDALSATCNDQLQNGDERGVDCGGTACPPCPPPSCTDGLQNRDETGVDCGGTHCAACLVCAGAISGQQCHLPVLSSVSPTASPTQQASMHASDCLSHL
jgi:hypothetical protein